MQVRTDTIAAWDAQSAGIAKLHLISRARSYIAKQQQFGTPCPEYMEVPESVIEAHERGYERRVKV